MSADPAGPLSDSQLLDVLHAGADAVIAALDGLPDWGLADTRPGQYRSDLAADDAVTGILLGAGLGVLSEESGLHQPDREVVVVVDPLDGSTNASRGLGWCAISLCAVDGDGPRAALVVDLSTRMRTGSAVPGARRSPATAAPGSRRFQAVRGGGADLDGEPIRPSGCTEMSKALVGLSGYPQEHLGWAQFRSLGAVALDLCEVARGGLDAFVDCSPSAHGPWDYLGGLLICHEAGASVVDAAGRDLVVLEHGARRTPLAAATPELSVETLEARRRLHN